MNNGHVINHMKNFYLLLSILLTSAPAVMSQQSQPVQFFPYGYYVDNDHRDDNQDVWKYSDTLLRDRPFLEKMIKKIESDFLIENKSNLRGIEGLNEYLTGAVVFAFEDSTKKSGIEWKSEQFWPHTSSLYKNYIQKLIHGYESELILDNYLFAGMPYSILLNNNENSHVLKLLQIGDVYWLSEKSILYKNDHPVISYGSMSPIGKNYYRMQGWPDSTCFMGLSVQPGASVVYLKPDTLQLNESSPYYQTLFDSLFTGDSKKFPIVDYYSITAQNSTVRFCNLELNEIAPNNLFTICFVNDAPRFFYPGKLMAVIKIDSRKYWITSFDYPWGLCGFRIYREDKDEFILEFEASLFSI